MFTRQSSHTYDWVHFEYTATKNMEICDLNSYTHAFIRSNNAKVNESIRYVCSSLVKMVSD